MLAHFFGSLLHGLALQKSQYPLGYQEREHFPSLYRYGGLEGLSTTALSLARVHKSSPIVVTEGIQ